MECDKSCGNAGVRGSESRGVEYVSMPVCVLASQMCASANVCPHVFVPFCVSACVCVCAERLSVGQAGIAEALHSSFSPNRATWVVRELSGAALALRSPADSHQI